jgi:CheY-like chemotaxis protein
MPHCRKREKHAVSELAGKRILLVEDELLVSVMVVDMLTDLGAEVVGPAATVSKGVALAETAAIDAAVLDVNIRGERVDPVAEALSARGIPMVFATGYRDVGLGHASSVIEKPYTKKALADALSHALELLL